MSTDLVIDSKHMLESAASRLELVNLRSALPSQVEFSCLSVPDFHVVDSGQDAMELDVFSRCSSTHSTKGHNPAEYNADATVVSAAAALASAAVSDPSYTQYLDNVVSHECSPSVSRFDPERFPRTISAHPPRRFSRTIWRSLTLRLVKAQSRHCRPE
jgi:hypothetical protein